MFRDKNAVRPGDLSEGDAFATKVVAVVGYSQDWAAYEGPSDWSDMEVARKGTKISEEAAQRLFPVCRHLMYRGG